MINFNQQLHYRQMNTVILTVILVPLIEIYLFIKIGSQIGAFNTILLIFFTAFVGIFYARYEGLNNFKSAQQGITDIFEAKCAYPSL